MKYATRALLCGVAGCAMVATVQAQPSGNASIVSDYVWRGSSQTRQDPAVQAGARWTAGNGVYASLWGSTVSYAGSDARSEFDAALGWTGSVGRHWTVDASVTRYLYPATQGALDWTELGLAAHWKQRAWLQLGYSGDALASGHPGTYAQLGARLPVADALRLEAAVARYWLSSRYAADYHHAQLGAVLTLAPQWELRLTRHETDRNARRLFPGNAGGRWELALQAAF